MESSDLLIARQRRGIGGHPVYRDLVGQEHLQRIGIAGGAAQFPALANDEDNFAASAVLFRQIQGSAQDCIVQYVGFFGRRIHWCGASTHRQPIHHRPRCQRPGNHRNSIVASAGQLQLVQHRPTQHVG